MKKFFITITVIVCLLISKVAFATDGYLGSGFGSSIANEKFCDTATTFRGQRVFKNESENLYLIYNTDGSPANYWTVVDAITEGYGSWWWYYGANSGSGNESGITSATYYQHVTGLGDSGSFSYVSADCGGTPAPVAPIINWWNGFLLSTFIAFF